MAKSIALILAIVYAVGFGSGVVEKARAATVDTFDFQQSLVASSAPIPATITGSFSGVPDASGYISLSSLDSFTMEGIDITPRFFSFNVSGGNSSLDLAVLGPAENVAFSCMGAAAAFGGGINGVDCGGGGYNGTAQIYTALGPPNDFAELDYVTQDLPQVTLVSSINTPNPSALPLMATGLAALGLFGWVTTKRKAATPASSDRATFFIARRCCLTG
jgi:hypothetical protein